MFNVKNIAKFLEPHTILYAVGGAVRDEYMDTPFDDVDICSSLTVNELKELLSTINGVNVEIISKQLGAARIAYNDKIYEYTTLRKEVFDQITDRFPAKIEFVDKIKADADRRDFTCNALYKNLITDEIVDFFEGKRDIDNKILRAIPPVNITMGTDPTRILRLIKFANKYNFGIDNETFDQSIKSVHNVSKLSKHIILKNYDQNTQSDNPQIKILMDKINEILKGKQ